MSEPRARSVPSHPWTLRAAHGGAVGLGAEHDLSFRRSRGRRRKDSRPYPGHLPYCQAATARLIANSLIHAANLVSLSAASLERRSGQDRAVDKAATVD